VSIVENWRRHGDEPYGYLRNVLTRPPPITNHQIRNIAPKAWAAAKKAAESVYQNLEALSTCPEAAFMAEKTQRGIADDPATLEQAFNVSPARRVFLRGHNFCAFDSAQTW
jgi:hypothetical protein